ncbi:ABC-2 type transport system ATP-binding protein [Kineosphaera limosa]|uniref:Putative ABC transporter ATP-binding protein n=1 Tax=Kineosphaera limosa NBRC 100340 TaxID=1184609 RepID=K6X7X9_9MICO|nr:ATP-binding cassette domain-containing protein [Kineosphaera limosa]NYE00900.1 ABC-2 type transport system ATP-binding protein [Kineosphaera limosa]GAB94904.1 putative ABC transporter ATP-binding protein [Kineosphaera limosa NBRC 100340]
MIHTQALTRTFTSGKQSVEAVAGIDLDIGRGELVAVLGPNGAGKSTTLRMLTSLLPPTSGVARVAGIDVTADPAGVRARIGYVGQKDGAGHNYRVADELLMQGRFYGLDRAAARQRVDELLNTLDLPGLGMRKVSTLSGGQKRRLDIALGLVHSPGLLFLDEPTTGMDPQARANLWEHIGALRERLGMTIVVTTHYLEEADAMAERVVIVDHGKIIADDTPARLKRNLAGDHIDVTVPRAQEVVAREVLAQLGTEPGTVPAVVDPVPGGAVPRAELVGVRVRVPSGPAALPPALARLAAAGVEVSAASAQQPTLDDVFLNLTGRSLREGAEA